MKTATKTVEGTDWDQLRGAIERIRRTQLRDLILTPLSLALLTAWLVWRGSGWFDYACVGALSAYLVGRMLATGRFVARSRDLGERGLINALRHELAKQITRQQVARAAALCAAAGFGAAAALLSAPVLLLGSGVMVGVAGFAHFAKLPRLREERAALRT